MYHEAPALLHDLPKITIAVVDGYATGAGMSPLALACDPRIASEKAAFATYAFWRCRARRRPGISWTLPRLVPRDIHAAGDNIDSRKRTRLGLVNRVATLRSTGSGGDAVIGSQAGLRSPACSYRYMKEKHRSISYRRGLDATPATRALSHASCASPISLRVNYLSKTAPGASTGDSRNRYLGVG